MKRVRGQRSNQQNYVPTRQINEMRNRKCLCGFARFAYRALLAPDCLKRRDFWQNRLQTEVGAVAPFHRQQKRVDQIVDVTG